MPHNPPSPRGTVRAVDNNFYRPARLASKRLINCSSGIPCGMPDGAHQHPDLPAPSGADFPATESGLEFIMERIGGAADAPGAGCDCATWSGATNISGQGRQRYALMNTKQRVSAQRGRASCRFGCQRVGCDRISPRNPPGTEDRDQQLRYPGNVGITLSRYFEASGTCRGLQGRNFNGAAEIQFL